ncbi:ribonuclease Z [Sporosarcina sp. Te-1]|uniref:ribonuclease Z n=1 Tax=Sporosarcina sp. Te-1 TaxID=2818390 RepID=UPI001A9DEF43|nr:ribonuclease Z [Sporosarcina sp. Te-1]QTD41756.1 ribonuclease Z [Sporosarcina sp. Te-1]
MEVIFLGTGAGMPSKQRNTSSLVINLAAEEEGYWMVDCGEATQHQLLHTTIKPRKINKIFITHLHGDHIFGLPGFLGSRSFLGGDEPLDIYGPAGLNDWLLATLRLTKTHLTYPLRVHEIEEGILFENDHFIVRTKRLQHVVPSYGFRIEQKPLLGKLLIDKAIAAGVPKGPLLQKLKQGEDIILEDGQMVRSKEVTGEPQKGFILAVLGDTSFCGASIELAEQADVVIHEATFDSETGQLAADYGHSTIVDAATIAKMAAAKNLIANHISARFLPGDLAVLLDQGKAVFPNLFIANDFSKYALQDGQVTEL